MPRPKQLPEQLTATLGRVALPPGHFAFKFLFKGAFETVCPRCQTPATVVAATLGLELSCGCWWHAPDKNRKRNKDSWVCFSRDQGTDECANNALTQRGDTSRK